MRLLAALAVLFASLSSRGLFLQRLMRNVFTPAIPRAVEPRYPLVDEAVLARDVTVVVGTKDAVTPTTTQLTHLGNALPAGVRVIYTYPDPVWDDKVEHEKLLYASAGPLARRLKLLAVDSFSNPFKAWLAAVPHVKTQYTLLMHNDVFLLDLRGHFLSELHGALEANPEYAGHLHPPPPPPLLRTPHPP